MSELVVSGLTKKYGTAVAVEDATFTVRDGEFLTLLGPSGCGKSTTLASIAGLQIPTRGRIAAGAVTYFDSDKGIVLPAEARDLGLVFQSYALWPHMSVTKNLRFPLQLRKIPRKEQDKRIADVLALVEMSDLADRYPHELSGGQQQRVALARTLVYEPAILLLDEPLSNLDAKLRERARTWLAEIRERIRLTTVYVTHDHGEALSLSDRIVVMNGGRIHQIGTPRDIYERPADAFVADFIGTSNFLHGVMKIGRDARDMAVVALTAGQEIKVKLSRDIAAGEPVSLAVRPERLQIVDPTFAPSEEGSLLEVTVAHRSYFGAHWHYDFDTGGETIKVSSPREHHDAKVQVFVPLEASIVFQTSKDAAHLRRAANASSQPVAA